MASILIVTGRSRGVDSVIETGAISIGRNEECDLQVLDDLVSRRHAEIRYSDGNRQYEIIDLHSANGVYVNNRLITQPTVLHHGDVIAVGETKILYSSRSLVDREAALKLFKQRGERIKSTMISRKSDFGHHTPWTRSKALSSSGG
jgi:pSer/pThr/pTyr-binding forkhead associated (FHA) protein